MYQHIFRTTTILLLMFQQSILLIESTTSVPNLRNNEIDASDPDILFYGWFLNETTATSLEQITQEYFQAMLKIPEVSQFMETVSQKNNVSDPLAYFVKPLDPNTLEFDPYFHITAKFCGSPDIDCSAYAAKVEDSINKQFTTELIGVFFTERTYGVRVLLSDAQLDLFEPDGEFRSKSGNLNDVQLNADYPGIIFEPQDPDVIPPTISRAHITLGCAPNISAVVTGLDLVNIVQSELNLNETFYEDHIIENIGNLRQYGKADNTSVPSFVLYLNNKMIVQTTFEAYESLPSRSPVVLPGLISLIALCVRLLIN